MYHFCWTSCSLVVFNKSHTQLLSNPSSFFFSKSLKLLQIWWSSGMNLGLQFSPQIFFTRGIACFWLLCWKTTQQPKTSFEFILVCNLAVHSCPSDYLIIHYNHNYDSWRGWVTRVVLGSLGTSHTKFSSQSLWTLSLPTSAKFVLRLSLNFLMTLQFLTLGNALYIHLLLCKDQQGFFFSFFFLKSKLISFVFGMMLSQCQLIWQLLSFTKLNNILALQCFVLRFHKMNSFLWANNINHSFFLE